MQGYYIGIYGSTVNQNAEIFTKTNSGSKMFYFDNLHGGGYSWKERSILTILFWCKHVQETNRPKYTLVLLCEGIKNGRYSKEN